MKDLIAQYQQTYYSGKPLITDDQYDALIDQSAEYEVSIGPKGDIDHLNPMYSLQKFYPCRGDTLPNIFGYVESDKLDGAAIELVYQRLGEDLFVLNRMVTRGDVSAGKLVSHKRHAALRIPSSFEYKTDHDFIQINGEVVSTKDVDNARNMASGKIQLDSDDEFAEAVLDLGLMFFAYNVTAQGMRPITPTYTQDMSVLAIFGFNTILSVPDLLSAKPMIKIVFDGKVLRMDNNIEFYKLGFTAKFPRGAFAVKEDKDFVVTTLLSVEWNTGRTGKVVPKAIIEPVEIDGAIVSKATLNNPKFIEAMGLYIGCKVKIIRSGEIIPCIIGLYE
jgi:NAD-dependent DNA ligase